MRKVKYPKRRVILTFTHDTCGDHLFSPKVDAAFSERLAAIVNGEIGDTADFRASNGVLIQVSGYEVTDGLFEWRPIHYATGFIRRKIREIKGVKDMAYMSEDGGAIIFLLVKAKNPPAFVMRDGVKFNLKRNAANGGAAPITPA